MSNGTPQSVLDDLNWQLKEKKKREKEAEAAATLATTDTGDTGTEAAPEADVEAEAVDTGDSAVEWPTLVPRPLAVEGELREKAAQQTPGEKKALDHKAGAAADKEYDAMAQYLSERFGIGREYFGAREFGGPAWARVVEEAKRNVEDPELKKALLMLNRVESPFRLLDEEKEGLTDANYAFEIKNYKTSFELDRLRDAEAKAEDKALASYPTGASAVIRYVPGGTSPDQYAGFSNKLAERFASAGGANLTETVSTIARLGADRAILLSLTENQPELRDKVMRQGAQALYWRSRAGAEAAENIPFIPLDSTFGKAYALDQARVFVLGEAILRFQDEHDGASPTEAQLEELTSTRMTELEQFAYAQDLPVYDGDPLGTLSKLLEFQQGLKDLSTASEHLGGPGPGAAIAIKTINLLARVLTPVELRSGYITIGDQEIRAAEDRFSEWALGGRSASTSSLDYLLALAPTEAVAPAYSLALQEMVDAYGEEEPDGTIKKAAIDGLIFAHPIDFVQRFWYHLDSDEATLDSAIRDDQYAMMLSTMGRAGNPWLAVLPEPESEEGLQVDYSSGAARMGAVSGTGAYRTLYSGIQGMSTASGFLGGLALAFKEPDAFMAAGKVAGGLIRGTRGSRLLNASRGVRLAQTQSVNNIPKGVGSLLDEAMLASRGVPDEFPQAPQLALDLGIVREAAELENADPRALANVVRERIQEVFKDINVATATPEKLILAVAASSLSSRGKMALMDEIITRTPQVQGGLTSVALQANAASINMRGASTPDTSVLTSARRAAADYEKGSKEVDEAFDAAQEKVGELTEDLQVRKEFDAATDAVRDSTKRLARSVGLDSQIGRQIKKIEADELTDRQIELRANRLMETEGEPAIDLIRTLWGDPKTPVKAPTKEQADLLSVFLAQAGQETPDRSVRETLEAMRSEGVDLEQVRSMFLESVLNIDSAPKGYHLVDVIPPAGTRIVYRMPDGKTLRTDYLPHVEAERYQPPRGATIIRAEQEPPILKYRVEGKAEPVTFHMDDPPDALLLQWELAKDVASEMYYVTRQATQQRRLTILKNRQQVAEGFIQNVRRTLDDDLVGVRTALDSLLARTKTQPKSQARIGARIDKVFKNVTATIKGAEQRMVEGAAMGIRRRGMVRLATKAAKRAGEAPPKTTAVKPKAGKLEEARQRAIDLEAQQATRRQVEDAAADAYFTVFNGQIRILETMRTLDAAKATTKDLAGLEHVFDQFVRGAYGVESFADVLGTQGPGVQKVAREIWGGDGAVANDWLNKVDGRASLETYRQTQWIFMDPASQSALNARGAAFTIRALESPAWNYARLMEYTRVIPAGLRDTFTMNAARWLRDASRGTSRVLSRGYNKPENLAEVAYQETIKAKRRIDVIEADTGAIDEAINAVASAKGLDAKATAELQFRARAAYLSRDLDAMSSPEFAEVFTIKVEKHELAGDAVLEEKVGVYVKGFAERGTKARALATGTTDTPLRMLNTDRPPLDDVVEHLKNVSRAWRDDMIVRYDMGKLDVGAPGPIVLGLAKVFMGERSAPGDARKVVSALLQSVRKDTAPIYNLTGNAKYNELRRLLMDAVGRDPTDDLYLPGERLLSGMITNGSAVARSKQNLIRMGIGVTAADARQLSLMLARGHVKVKAEGANLVQDLALFESVAEDIQHGASVYLMNDLQRLTKLPFGKTGVPARETLEGKVKTRVTDEGVTEEVPAYGPYTGPAMPVPVLKPTGKGFSEVHRPEYSGTPMYRVVEIKRGKKSLKQPDKEGDVDLVVIEPVGRDGKPLLGGRGSRTVTLKELRTVPPPVKAGQLMDQLARMGVTVPGKSAEAEVLRFMMLVGDDQVPHYVVKQATRDLDGLLEMFTKNLEDATSKATDPDLGPIEKTLQVVVEHLGGLRPLGAFLSTWYLYGDPLLRVLGGSGRVGRAMLEDTSSALMRSGPFNAAVVGLSGANAWRRNIQEGRTYLPGAELLSTLASSMTAAGRKIGLDRLIPDDLALILNGPLKTLDSSDPKAIFRLPGGRTIKNAEGKAMTVGQVKDELVAAGVYDTFHSRHRDATLLQNIRDTRKAPGRFKRMLEAATPARARELNKARQEALFRATNDVSTEQRASLYLAHRVRGAPPAKAEGVINTNLLNWTEPSMVSTPDNLGWLVIYLRAKEQAIRQTTRQYMRFLGGEDDALRPFIVYARMKERVVPYAFQAYMSEASEENEEEYWTAVRQMEAARSDWEEPYAYLYSQPFSETERARLNEAIGGGEDAPDISQAHIGTRYSVAVRGDYDEFAVPIKLMSAASAFTMGATMAQIIGSKGPSVNIGVDDVTGAATKFLFDAVNDNVNPIIGDLMTAEEDLPHLENYEKPGLRPLNMAMHQLNTRTGGLIGTQYTGQLGRPRRLGEGAETVLAPKIGPSTPGAWRGFNQLTNVAQRNLERDFQTVHTQLALTGIFFGGEAKPPVKSVLLMEAALGTKAAEAFALGPRQFMGDEFNRDVKGNMGKLKLFWDAQTQAMIMPVSYPTLIRQRDIRESDAYYFQQKRGEIFKLFSQAYVSDFAGDVQAGMVETQDRDTGDSGSP